MKAKRFGRGETVIIRRLSTNKVQRNFQSFIIDK